MGTDFAGTSLFIHPNHINLIEAEVMPTIYKLLPSIITFGSATIAYLAYQYNPKMLVSFILGNARSDNKGTDTNLGYNLYKFLNGKYYIEVLYNTYVIPGALGLGYVVSKQLDRGLIEQIFGYGITSGLSKTSKDLAKLDDSTLPSYAVYFAVSLVILTIVLIMPILTTITYENMSVNGIKASMNNEESLFNMVSSVFDIRVILVFIIVMCIK